MSQMQSLVKEYAFLINARDNVGKTALHHGSMNGRIDVIEFLAKEMAGQLSCSKRRVFFSTNGLCCCGTDLNAQDNLGNTAMHIAVEHNKADTVKALLAFGADARRTNVAGDSAMHLAARRNHVESLEVRYCRGCEFQARLYFAVGL